MLGSRRVIHYTCWIDPKRLWRHLTALWLSTPETLISGMVRDTYSESLIVLWLSILKMPIVGTVKVSPSVVWIGMKRLWRPLIVLWLSILKMPISGLGGDTYSDFKLGMKKL